MALFDTVADAIARVGTSHPRQGYTFMDMKGDEHWVPYPELEARTATRAAALQRLGLAPGDRMGLIVVEPLDFVLTFHAALRVGIVPVPLYPPLSFGALDAYGQRTARVLELSGAKVLVASTSLQNVLWGLVDRVSTLKELVKVETLEARAGTPDYPAIAPEDVAFLQYTSGSTSDPKGVVVTHANLVANCDAIINQGIDMEETGVCVAWLPLYHDMGLIGFVISPILHAMKAVFIPTLRFLKRPHVWFDTLTKHQATVTFAPNFAYALITRKATDKRLATWDLSSVRVFGCGAEPIHPETVRAFEDTFRPVGLADTAFLPAYGMAEATLAISFKPLTETWQTRVVDAVRFRDDGEVAAPDGDDPLVFEHVSCGRPFADHEIAVMDADDTPLPEGREGELCLRGPSVSPGYHDNPEATAEAFRDGWLHTGDLGYVLDGEVYVTGRMKDLIILNGRNLHPQAVEWAAAEVEGVRKGNVVAFSRPGDASEELVVVLETRSDDHDVLTAAVKQAVRQEVGQAPADIVCLPPGSLPKTSSGKLQRRKTRGQYLTGSLGVEGTRTMGATGSTTTVAKHVARSVLARAKARAKSTLFGS